MRWEDEIYVRLFTRETPKMANWTAQTDAVFCKLIRRVDRAGIIEFYSHQELAHTLRVPLEWVPQAIQQLSDDSDGRRPTVVLSAHGLVIRNFTKAQSARTSDRERKRLQRERDRDDAVTNVTAVTAVTDVTLSLAELIKTKSSDVHIVTNVTPVTASQGAATPLVGFEAKKTRKAKLTPQGEEITPEMIHSLIAFHAAQSQTNEAVKPSSRKWEWLRSALESYGQDDCRMAIQGILRDQWWVSKGLTGIKQVFGPEATTPKWINLGRGLRPVPIIARHKPAECHLCYKPWHTGECQKEAETTETATVFDKCREDMEKIMGNGET